MLLLIWILVFKLSVRFSRVGPGERSLNFIPFSEPLILNGKADFGEMILNAVIFVPLGMYSGILFKTQTFGKQLLRFSLLSLGVEGCQYIFSLGASDITDIVTNTAGGTLGLMLYKGVEKAFGDNLKAQRFVNAIATVGTVLIIVLLWLLKMNRLPVRYQ